MIFSHTKNLLTDPLISANYKVLILLLDYYRSGYYKQGSERFKNISKDDLVNHTGYSKNHLNKLLRFIAFSYEPEALHIRENYIKLKFIKNSIYDKKGNEKKGTCFSDLIEVEFLDNKLTLYDNTDFELPKGFSYNEIKKYLDSSKYFKGLKPGNLLNLTGANNQENLLQGLFYVDTIKREIKNPAGYLKTCFDANGKFKYLNEAPALNKAPKESKLKISENLVYKITFNDFQTLKNFKFDDYKICSLHYSDFVLITSMTYQTKPANPKNLLTKLGLKYEAFKR